MTRLSTFLCLLLITACATGRRVEPDARPLLATTVYEGQRFGGEKAPESGWARDLERVIDRYIEQPPLLVGDLGDEVPMSASDTRQGGEAPLQMRRGRVVAMPIPIIDPTIGTGLAAAVGYVHRPDLMDQGSPPSVLGIGGFATDNHSWTIGIGWRGFFHNDRWRVLIGAGVSSLRYDYYGIGTDAGDMGLSIPLRQDQTAGLLQVVRRISKSAFLGPRLRYRDTQNVLADVEDVTGLPPPGSELNATTVGLGLYFEDDTRDSILYPRDGHLFDLFLDFFDDAWGSDFTYQIATIAYSHYIPVRERDVLAFRAYGRFSFGDVPFFDLSLFGRSGDLRGYVVGQYRDRMLAAVQAEYRYNFAERWGAVAFAGIGQVAPDLDAWSSDALLPSAGAGLRYTIGLPAHLNLRLDFAWGREDFGVYLGITEVF